MFLGIAKAFDKVWHIGPVWKLKQADVSDYLTLLNHSSIKNRTFQVQVGGVLSTARYIRSDVPQGTLLGPFLYIIYSTNMPFNTFGTIPALYDNDIRLMTRSARPEVLYGNNCVQELQYLIIDVLRDNNMVPQWKSAKNLAIL